VTAPTTFGVEGAFKRYRIMAYVTGVLLILLVFVAVPLKYFGDTPGPVRVLGVAHGWLFMVYLAFTLHLGLKLQWEWPRLGLRMLAGTVPFAAFFVERQVHAEVDALMNPNVIR